MRTNLAAALVPAALLLVGPCIAVAAAALQSAAGSALLSGAIFALAGPERCLALIGIGLAAATGARRRLVVAAVCLLLGVLIALAARATPVWPLLTEAGVYRRLHLLGPLAAVLSGLVLVLPDRPRRIAMAPAAVFVGLALTLTAIFNDPDPDAGIFALGAALVFLWLPLIVASVARAVRRPWFAVPERIAGSWCLAIGLLLAGVQLIPPKASIAVPAASPAMSVVPNFDPMLRLDDKRPAALRPDSKGRPQSY